MSDRAPHSSRFELAIDRAISFFDPERAARRLQNREQFLQFSYAAANPGTLRGKGGSRQRNASSESHQSRRDRVNLMWEARQSVNDICMLRGLMLKIPMYVVGRLEYRPDTGNPDLDKIYGEYFHRWCENCDLTGRYRLIELTQKALRSMLIDGDAGGLMSVGPGGLKLQLIEADRIGNPDQGTISDTFISGIRLDEIGAVTGYDVYRRSPLTTGYTYEDTYSPEVFKHLMDGFRVDQYRGVSHLATAIPHVRDLYELFGYEKVANKFASMWAAFVYRKDPFGQNGTGGTGPKWDSPANPATGEKNMWDAVPGRVQVLSEGEQIAIAQGSNRPSGAFMNFVNALIREVAQTFNLPTAFVSGDMSMLGGATSRIELEQAQRSFQYWQDLLRYRWLNPLKNAVIEYGIARGDIPATPMWRNGEWNFGAFITADVTYAGQMDVVNIQTGLDSMTDVLARRGQDISAVARKKVKDVRVFQEAAAGGEGSTPIPIEMLTNVWTNPSQMLAEAQTPPQPPPSGLVNQTQDLKPLMDLIKQVGDGTIERASAIESVVGIYGVSKEEAAGLVPESTGKTNEPSNEKPEPKPSK